MLPYAVLIIIKHNTAHKAQRHIQMNDFPSDREGLRSVKHFQQLTLAFVCTSQCVCAHFPQII